MSDKLTEEELKLYKAIQNKINSDRKVCEFKPTRSGQAQCEETSTVFYKGKGFCKKHCRSVQALNLKKEESEQRTNVTEEVAETPKVEPKEEVEKVDKVDEKVSATPVASPKEKVAKVAVQPKEKVASTAAQPKDLKTPKSTPPKEKVASTAGPVTDPKPVFKKLDVPTEIVQRTKVTRKLKQNAWGRFEDKESGLVFDARTKAAIGVQDHKTGEVTPLKKKDIEICKRHEWKYIVPAVQTPPKHTPTPAKAKVTVKAPVIPDEESEDEEEGEEDEEESEEEEEGEDEEEEEGEDEEEEEGEDEEEEGEEESEDEEEGEDEEEICQVCSNTADECICVM